jgi:hypothetical protein
MPLLEYSHFTATLPARSSTCRLFLVGGRFDTLHETKENSLGNLKAMPELSFPELLRNRKKLWELCIGCGGGGNTLRTLGLINAWLKYILFYNKSSELLSRPRVWLCEAGSRSDIVILNMLPGWCSSILGRVVGVVGRVDADGRTKNNSWPWRLKALVSCRAIPPSDTLYHPQKTCCQERRIGNV